MQQPFVSTSLQAAPGFPATADQRPHKGCVPELYTDVNGTHVMQWLQPDLSIFNVHNGSTAY